jgi:uncharacterized protein YndB with AHSA1/START domain
MNSDSATIDSSDPAGLLVRLERIIRATPDCVWQEVSSPAGLGAWLGPKTYEPQIGGRILFDVLHGTRPDGAQQRWLMFGSVTVFEPEAELAFTWQEFNVPELTAWPAPTTVSIQLAAVEGGATRVTLTHSGFDRLPKAAEEYAGYAAGWASLNDLEQLAAVCEAPR